MDIGEAALGTIVIVSQLGVIDTAECQNGGMEVVNGRDIRDRFMTKLIGCPIRCPPLDPRSHHPDSESIRVMIAPGGSYLVGWHSSELGRPENEGVIEEPTALHICE